MHIDKRQEEIKNEPKRLLDDLEDYALPQEYEEPT